MPPAVFSAYAVEIGQPITVEAFSVSSPHPGVTVERDADGPYQVRASRHGTYTLDLGDGARTEVLFHLPLEEVVRRRAAYMARYQRARERPGLLAHAFVPVDTRTSLTQPTNGWSDWTDGSERIAMPLLLQAAAARGLADPEEIAPLLDGWSRFARHHLLDETAAPRRGSQNWRPGPRLYDTPGRPISSTTGTAPSAGGRTSTSQPASSSAASNSAAPLICRSASRRRRWPSATAWTPPDKKTVPVAFGTNWWTLPGSSSAWAGG